ncbi:MAG: flagellin [Alphaproteobacteria bacterium]|nr:flagellin [Alphaproteobacteria bacterium]
MTVINSNISALKAQSSLTKNAIKLDTAMERLSTGYRINSAKDDAAGLAITNRMTSQIQGLNQAVRNANDGIAMIATIEGALAQTTNVMQRMRELAVQAANDSNSTEDRQYLHAEMVQLNNELDRISSQARFNGIRVLDGTFTNKQLQVGANGSETVAFSVDSAAAADIGVHQKRVGTIGVVNTETTSTATASVPASPISGGTLTISGFLGTTGVTIDRLDSARLVAAAVNDAFSNTGVAAKAVTKAKLSSLSAAGTITFSVTGKNSTAITVSTTISSTSDLTSLAAAFNTFSSQTGITAELSTDKLNVILTSGDGYDIQLADYTNNGNGTINVIGLAGNGEAISAADTAITLTATTTLDSARIIGDVLFESSKEFTLKDNAGTAAQTNFVGQTAQPSSLASMSTVNIQTQSGAGTAISIIDGALTRISSMRADLGAISSRLEKTVDALTSSSVNTAAARSRILDTDYAAETSALAKSQIIAQASTAMLAQANQQPQQVLQLLKQ